jgi:hypothetical protein
MVDPHETPEDRVRHELFQCYRRGWKHGTCRNARDRRFTDHHRGDIGAAYVRGYSDGEDAATLSAAREAERIGYDPRFSILRSMPPVDPPEATVSPSPEKP